MQKLAYLTERYENFVNPVPVNPKAQPTVLGQAIGTYIGAGKNNVAVSGANLDCFYHLDQIHTVLLVKETPLIKKCSDG